MAIRFNQSKKRGAQLHRTFVSARRKAEQQNQKVGRNAKFNLATVQNEIASLLKANESEDHVLVKLTDLACQVSSANWCGLMQFDSGQMELLAQSHGEFEGFSHENSTIRSVCQLAAESQSAEINCSESMSIVAAPVLSRLGVNQTRCICLLYESRIDNPDTCELFAQLIATAISQLSSKKDNESLATKKLLEKQLGKLVSAVVTADSQKKAAEHAARGLLRVLSAQSVAIGLCNDQSTIGEIIQRGEHSDEHNSHQLERYKTSMNEVLRSGRPLISPNAESLEPDEQNATSELLTYMAGSIIVSAPMTTKSGQVLAVTTCSFADTDDDTLQQKIEFLKIASTCLADCLECTARAGETVLQKSWKALKSVTRSRLSVIAIATYMLLAGILAIPVPHLVECDAVLQPAIKRFVVTPEQGVLRELLVEPGQMVRAQQLVAQLDDTHLISQRDELFANRAMLLEKINLGQYGELSPALLNLQIEKIEEQISRISQRIDDCRIYSPIEGMVIEADLHGSENVPVQVGESLMMIVPMDKLFLQIELDQNIYQYVGTAQELELRLASQPGTEITSTIKTVRPDAKRSDKTRAFIAQATIENPGNLRPGMSGKVQIKEQNRAIGWILFRRGFKPITQLLN